MSRLPSALLLAWLAVIGAAGPAVACAAMPVDNCCPDEGTVPCPEGDPPAHSGTGAACDTAVPVPVQATPNWLARGAQEPIRCGPHEPALLPVSTIAPVQAAARNERTLLPADSPARDASLTYLHTQRLRL